MIIYVIQSVNPWTRTLATNCYYKKIIKSLLSSLTRNESIRSKVFKSYIKDMWAQPNPERSLSNRILLQIHQKRWIFLVILSTRMFSPLQHWTFCLLRFPGVSSTMDGKCYKNHRNPNCFKPSLFGR